jgi:hypothetical protein
MTVRGAKKVFSFMKNFYKRKLLKHEVEKEEEYNM